ncbi:hypothetical protein SAMN06296020_10771 [Anoxynatronum buryatiense]|uniref:Uncharacterized protein n=1 Tax=Anoxynatronum buryatiense TaxID=489973 RepID=A0AA46AJ52_9CLOT|nr:hypothetical protein SAMN06296020_10771 [Anoxynatronum buryatiense]
MPAGLLVFSRPLDSVLLYKELKGIANRQLSTIRFFFKIMESGLL